jgi:hypothetical protein
MAMTENWTSNEQEVARLISEKPEPIEMVKAICPTSFLELERVKGLDAT